MFILTDQDIHILLRSHGIFRTLKGWSTLVNLVLLTAKGHPCNRSLLRAQAKQEQVSLSILIGRLNYLQHIVHFNDEKLFDDTPSPYRLIFVLAHEAVHDDTQK